MWLASARSLAICAGLLAASSCYAVDTALDDCKKGKTVTVIKKRSLVPPAPAASAASAPKLKKVVKKRLVPAAEPEPCPPLKFPTPFSFIPPPDATTIPPDSPIMPQEAPLPLVMTVVPFGPECFCDREDGGGFVYVGYPVGGGGGGSFYVPQTPVLPPAPEPYEWALVAAGLLMIAGQCRRAPAGALLHRVG